MPMHNQHNQTLAHVANSQHTTHTARTILVHNLHIYTLTHATNSRHITYGSSTRCRAFVDSMVFLVTPCEFPIFLNIGHMRQGRSLSDGGSRCHRHTHRIGGCRQRAKSKFQGAQHNGHKCRITNTRMANASNIHRDRDHKGHINVIIM